MSIHTHTSELLFWYLMGVRSHTAMLIVYLPKKNKKQPKLWGMDLTCLRPKRDALGGTPSTATYTQKSSLPQQFGWTDGHHRATQIRMPNSNTPCRMLLTSYKGDDTSSSSSSRSCAANEPAQPLYGSFQDVTIVCFIHLVNCINTSSSVFVLMALKQMKRSRATAT